MFAKKFLESQPYLMRGHLSNIRACQMTFCVEMSIMINLTFMKVKTDKNIFFSISEIFYQNAKHQINFPWL